MAERQQKGERTYRGIAVSSGVCRGKVLVLHRTRHMVARRELAENEIAGEISRFEQALVQTRQQILEVQRKVLKELSAADADIFDAVGLRMARTQRDRAAPSNYRNARHRH